MAPPREHNRRVRRAVFVGTLILFLVVTGVLMMNAFAHGSQDQLHNTSTHIANVLLFPMYPLSAFDRLHPISESVYDCLFAATWLVAGAFWATLITFSYVTLHKWQTK